MYFIKKEKYERTGLEVIKLQTEDVITTSDPVNEEDELPKK